MRQQPVICQRDAQPAADPAQDAKNHQARPREKPRQDRGQRQQMKKQKYAGISPAKTNFVTIAQHLARKPARNGGKRNRRCHENFLEAAILQERPTRGR